MILDETRERFLKAIAKQVDPARIAEVHFFAPIRQGGVESGVAVIVAEQNAVAVSQVDDVPSSDPSMDARDRGPSEASPPQDDTIPQDDDTPQDDDIPHDGTRRDDGTAIERHVIYTARYRLTLKGPDRGKWETNVTAEADAPIITVDAVVRGVQRRAGDVDDPTRMNGDEVRAALPTPG